MIDVADALRRGQSRGLTALLDVLAARPKLASRVVVLMALGASAYFGTHVSKTPIFVIFGVLGLAAIAQFPKASLPLLVLGIAFVPFQLGTGTGSAINIAFIGVGGLAALWIVRMLLSGVVTLRPSELNRPWFALIAVTGLSIVAGAALWNPWVVTKDNFVFVQVAQWAVFAVSAFAFWIVGNETTDRKTLRTLTAIVIVLCAVAVLLGRVPGLPNAVNRVLADGPVFRLWAVALATGLALFDVTLRKSVRVAMFALAFAVVVVPWLNGRDWASGWMPSLITMMLIVLLAMWHRHQRLTTYLVTLGAVLFLLYLIPQIADEDSWSLNTRLAAWRGLAELLEGRWILGLGLASYWHYWRGVFGVMEFLDPETGYLHYTFDPKVNMHNNWVDLVGQAGILGLAVVMWLFFAAFRQSVRGFRSEVPGFGKAYAAACVGGVVGMAFAGMLADWVFPFVYNIGLAGYRSSVIGWLLLGGVVALEATRARATEAPRVDQKVRGEDHSSVGSVA